jgi:hypothetical protein
VYRSHKGEVLTARYLAERKRLVALRRRELFRPSASSQVCSSSPSRIRGLQDRHYSLLAIRHTPSMNRYTTASSAPRKSA